MKIRLLPIILMFLHTFCVFSYNDFWGELLVRDKATIGDSLNAFSLIMKRDDLVFKENLALTVFKQKGWIPEKWNVKPESDAESGFVAVIFKNIVQKRLGLKLKLFTHHERAAVQVLSAYNLVPQGGYQRKLSGEELISIMRNLQTTLKKENKLWN